MLGDITVAENIYIACGYTDMRKSIDGLATIVQQQFQLDPFSNTLFLFCGRNRNRASRHGKVPGAWADRAGTLSAVLWQINILAKLLICTRAVRT